MLSARGRDGKRGEGEQQGRRKQARPDEAAETTTAREMRPGAHHLAALASSVE